jgi:hypothetical protein
VPTEKSNAKMMDDLKVECEDDGWSQSQQPQHNIKIVKCERMIE